MRPYVRVQGHRVSTAHLQAAYPFIVPEGLGSRGVLVGSDFYTGSAFCYDPFELVTQGLISDANMLVLGRLGSGKSSLLKTFFARSTVFGRMTYVLDPKGEFAPVAEHLGVACLAPGGGIRLNPLDPGPGADDLPAGEVRDRRLQLLLALVTAGLGRPLTPGEVAAIAEGLDAGASRNEEVILPHVLDALADPTPEAADNTYTTRERLLAESRDVTLVLRRMVHGDLRGLFDGPTSVKIDWDRGLVVDLGRLENSPALARVVLCAGAWLAAAIARPTKAKKLLVVDEAWKVLPTPGVPDMFRSWQKLSRKYGLGVVLTTHRLADVQAAGGDGTAARTIAEGLLSDCATRVIYAQDAAVSKVTAGMLGLNKTEEAALQGLDRGVALWQVGTQRFVVRHLLATHERPLVETNQAMNVEAQAVV